MSLAERSVSWSWLFTEFRRWSPSRVILQYSWIRLSIREEISSISPFLNKLRDSSALSRGGSVKVENYFVGTLGVLSDSICRGNML